ncbi:hypothetical protein [Streptomyces kronopolitis]|uniref:hypothetical protein n=1 Tax=Streptomyces kronopolitis TaxID=1612435 RepID=UPI00343D2B69
MSTTENKQAPRTAWINAMRSEVLRVGKAIPEVARVVHVGIWIATYADSDGSNAFPGRDTLSVLAGCSQETVTRAVRVLMGVGALERRRRPNTSTLYQLSPAVLLPGALPWEEHIHHYTDTRQRKAHAKKKAEQAATRTASMDAIQGEGPDSVRGRRPDSVHGGGSESNGENPDSVHGRPRAASTDAVRTASTAGVYKGPSTSGRDPRRDKERAEHPEQPPQRAAARGEDDSPQQPAEPAVRPCSTCETGQVVRPERDRCGGCLAVESGRKTRRRRHGPVQGAFLLPLAGGGQGAGQRRSGVSWPREDPAEAPRTCGCGREYRLRTADRCPACLVAAEEERRALGVVSDG